ncbi:hypothetical protein D3C76_956280 [compost metagenome]
MLPAGGTTNLISKGGIRIEGPITHIGDYNQTGKMTVSIDVVAAGISLVTHKHGGVMSGPGTTGVPVK